MSNWTQTITTPGERCWQRPLGNTEATFHWDGFFNGTADTVMHVHLRTTRPEDIHLCGPDNVHRAWLSMKRRFPLLAAEVHEEDGVLYFAVREQNITGLRKDELTIGTVSSFQDAERHVFNILDGQRPLSPELLVKPYVLQRTERPGHFHVILIVSHCITDLCSTSTILRTFFQTLATSYDPDPPNIEERLQMCKSLESQVWSDDLPPAKRRWRKALGYVLHAVRRARITGGHTLPGNYTAAPVVPAKSRVQVISFPRDLSALILSNCRRHKVTLNCAYQVLSQVALSRLLCRRYLRGEISQEEWEYRKREPMIFLGMVNLRSYENPEWFRNGGSGEVGLNYSFYHHVLPFMPLGVMAGNDIDNLELVDGAPFFPDLMSFDRFLLRCNGIKSRSHKMFRHPRFLDVCLAGHADRLEQNKATALAWRTARERFVATPEELQPLPVQGSGPTLTQAGSTLGDMDEMIPLDYPLPANHKLSPLCPTPHPHRAGYPICAVARDIVQQCQTPRLHVEYWRTHLHFRPRMVYLGAVTCQKQLQFFGFYDQNVHSAEVIREWLGELKDAILWYLGPSYQDVGGKNLETKTKSKL